MDSIKPATHVFWDYATDLKQQEPLFERYELKSNAGTLIYETIYEILYFTNCWSTNDKTEY